MVSQTNSSQTIAAEFTDKIARQNKKDKLIQLAPIGVLIALFIVFSILNPNFGTMGNVITILGQTAVPMCITLGITFVILLGSIDLSVDGVMALTGAVVSMLVTNNMNSNHFGIWGVLLSVAIGALCGLIVGLVYEYAKSPSFMVSFGMSGIAMGLATAVTKAIPPTITDDGFRSLALKSVMGLPIMAWISFGLFILAYIVQEYTAFGRYLFAIGNSEEIPRMTGINIRAVKLIAFAWSGAFIGLAGVLGAARLGMGTVLIGRGNLFPAMTAVVLGGTSLAGGKGGVLNTLLGVLIATSLTNGLVLMGVSSDIQTGIQSLIIVLAVALSAKHGRSVINQ